MSRYDDDGASGGSKPTEEINVVSEDTSNVEAGAEAASKSNNNNENVATSQSVAGADAEAENGR